MMLAGRWAQTRQTKWPIVPFTLSCLESRSSVPDASFSPLHFRWRVLETGSFIILAFIPAVQLTCAKRRLTRELSETFYSPCYPRSRSDDPSYVLRLQRSLYTRNYCTQRELGSSVDDQEYVLQ